MLTSLGILFCVLFALLVYGLWQKPVRISQVVIYGADQSNASIALAAIQGSYLGVIPRDSTFFLPESRIRDAIMAAHPNIAAISIYRNGLTGLSIKVNDRVPVARWCGSVSDAQIDATRFTPNASSTRLNLVALTAQQVDTANCYFFDANGFVYETEDTISPVNSFVIYESIATASSLSGSTLPNANKFPAAFEFARQLSTLGSPVVSIVFRGDEVDDYLKSGTRVTYVLSNEKNAFTALSSAHSSINLANGSLEYVDLRFDGKIYLKKVEAKK